MHTWEQEWTFNMVTPIVRYVIKISRLLDSLMSFFMSIKSCLLTEEQSGQGKNQSTPDCYRLLKLYAFYQYITKVLSSEFAMDNA